MEKSQPDYRFSLWEQALTSLEPELKAVLDVKCNKRQILALAIDTAEETKRLCMQKRWKYKKANGDVIIVRDVCEKIISWMQKFKDAGDIAVQFDPMHASLPWAGVRFLLQVASSDKEIFGSMTEGLEKVSHLITRYAIFEDLYLQPDSALNEDLEEAITALYADILVYIGKAKKYFQKSTAGRILHSSFQIGSSQGLSSIALREVKLSELARLADAMNDRQERKGLGAIENVLKSLELPMARFMEQTALFSKKLQKDKYHSILRWLSAVPYTQHQQMHDDQRVPGTGQWLLEHPQYLQWKRSSVSSILLLHGTLGSGKTMLASSVIASTLAEHAGQPFPVAFGYFYCARNAYEIERSDPDEIMRSIIRQLALLPQDQTIRDPVVAEYERRQATAELDGFDIPKLRISECLQIVLDLTASNPAVIVIDALDECQDLRRYDLLQALIRIVQDSSSVVKIFVTSRTDNSTLMHLSASEKIEVLQHEVKEDLEAFVQDALTSAILSKQLLNGILRPKFQAELKRTLLQNAQGIFIIPKLQLQTLCKMKLEADVREAAKRFSQASLGLIYESIYVNIFQSERWARKAASRIFAWLLCMHEPLKTSALVEAVTEDRGPLEDLNAAQILEACSGLVVVDAKLDALRFAHVSVQDFLQAKPHFSDSEANAVAALSCLEACIRGPLILEPPSAFFTYATIYWAAHCRRVFTNNDNIEVTEKLRTFIWDDEEGTVAASFDDWISEACSVFTALAPHHPMKPLFEAISSQTNTPLFVACFSGLYTILSDVLDLQDPCDWDQRNRAGHTGLYLASRFGHYQIVKFLVDKGVDINVSCGTYGSPLQAACFAGHVEIAQLLLELKANPKIGGKFKNALEAALTGDHEDICKLLLASGFSITEQQEYSATLRQAAYNGLANIVRVLCNDYRNTFAQDESAKAMAIQAAVYKGHRRTLQRLLVEEHQDLAILKIALQVAALGGQNAMVEALLAKEVDVNCLGHYGTPLRAAALKGHESTVQLLLENGANINEPTPLGSALQAAAFKGHTSVVFVLLRSGANVKQEGGHYGCALQAAAFRGHNRVIELLVSAGATISQAGMFEDAFQAAVQGGQDTAVRQFLAAGYEAPQRAYSMMHFAERGLMRWSFLSKVKPRLTRQTQFQDSKQPSLVQGHPNNSGRPSLADVFAGGQFVTGEETNFNNGDSYSTPHRDVNRHESNLLVTACSKGFKAVAKTLLDERTAVGVYEHNIFDAFQAAAEKGHEEIVMYLNESEETLSVHKMWDFKRTEVIESAAYGGHLSVVEYLIMNERTNRDIDPDLQAAMASAASGDHPRLVSRIFDIIDGFGSAEKSCKCREKALLTAAGSGSNSVIKLVLENPYTDLLGTKQGTIVESNALPKIAEDLYDESNAVIRSEKEATFSIDILGEALTAACESNKQAFHNILDVIPEGSLLPREHEGLIEGIARAGNYDMLTSWFAKALLPFNADTLLLAVRTASLHGESEFLRQILETPLDPADQKPVFELLFIEACRGGHTELADMLLQKGIDVNARIKIPKAPDGGYFPTALEVVLESFTVSDNHIDQSERKPVLPMLLDKGASLSADEVPRLIEFVSQHAGPAELDSLVNTAVARNLWMGDLGRALEKAAMRSHKSFPVVEILVKAGAILDAPRAEACVSTILEHQEDDDYSSIEEFMNGPGNTLKYLMSTHEDISARGKGFDRMLEVATAAGDREFVEMLIRRGVDVNSEGVRFGSALQAAAWIGDLEMLKLLISSGANVKVVDGCMTALRRAVLAGHLEVVKQLLHEKADVTDDLIFFPCGSGDNEMLQLLISSGADLNATQDKASDYELFSAANHLLHAMLEQEDKYTPICKASYHGKALTVRLLLDAGASVNNFALYCASYRGHEEIVRWLLEYKAQLYLHGGKPENALRAACLGKHKSITSLLLRSLTEAVRFRVACEDALSEIYRGKDEDMFQHMIDHDVVPTSTALALAAGAGFASTVKRLLDENPEIDPDEKTGYGTPLGAAAYGCFPEIVNLLLIHGADPMLTDPKRGLPIRAALEGMLQRDIGETYRSARFGNVLKCIKACESLVQSLRREIAAADTLDVEGHGDLLLMAASIGSRTLVQLLLDAGADVNTRGGERETVLKAVMGSGDDPFYYGGPFQYHGWWDSDDDRLMSIESRLALFDYLLERGADPDLAFGDGTTPLQYACSNRGMPFPYANIPPNLGWGEYASAAFADLLIKHGARTDGYGEPGVPVLLERLRDRWRAVLMVQPGSPTKVKYRRMEWPFHRGQ